MLVLMRRRGEIIECTLPKGAKIVLSDGRVINGEDARMEIVTMSVERNRTRLGIRASRVWIVDRSEMAEWKRQVELGEANGNVATGVP